MKHLFIFTFLILLKILAQAEDHNWKDTVSLEPGESFVVNLKVIKKIFQDKCYCPNNGSKCSLWLVRITKILYLPKDTFLDSSNLLLIKYMTVSEKYIDSMYTEKDYTVSLVPSASDKYLSIRRIINPAIKNETRFKYAGQAMYYNSKFTCKKKRPWPIRLLYSKKNKYIVLTDPFAEALISYENKL